MCSQYEETVDHILSGWEVLPRTEYITKNNKPAAYLHWRICQDYDIEVTNKWYGHKPETDAQYRQRHYYPMGYGSQY